jgi:hypothetical protein
MSTVNIVTLIAIILFARLGIRLYKKYREMNEGENENQGKKD